MCKGGRTTNAAAPRTHIEPKLSSRRHEGPVKRGMSCSMSKNQGRESDSSKRQGGHCRPDADSEAVSPQVTEAAASLSGKKTKGLRKQARRRSSRRISAACIPQIRATARASLSRLSSRASSSRASSARSVVALCTAAIEALGAGAKPAFIADIARHAAEAFDADAITGAELDKSKQEVQSLRKQLAEAESNSTILRARVDGAATISACVMRTALSFFPRVQSVLNPERAGKRERNEQNKEARDDLSQLITGALALSDQDAPGNVPGQRSQAALSSVLVPSTDDADAVHVSRVQPNMSETGATVRAGLNRVDLADSIGRRNLERRSDPVTPAARREAQSASRRNVVPEPAIAAFRAALRRLSRERGSSAPILTRPATAIARPDHLVAEEQSSEEELHRQRAGARDSNTIRINLDPSSARSDDRCQDL